MTASPDMAAGYDDALALNHIHALLASPDAPRDIAGILASAGRPPWPSRIITAAVEDDAHGMPIARIDTDGTPVFIQPNGPGLLIRVTPRDQVDADALETSAAGTVIRHPGPPRGRP
jgi:hypothetical protein